MHVTEAQRRVVEAVREYIRMHGYAPSLKDLARSLGLASTTGVRHHLLRLEHLGIVQRTPGVPRSIRLMDPKSDNHLGAARQSQ